VEPKQLPRELTQITHQRRVSMGRPGPIMYSHQPGEGSSTEEAAWALGESPVKTSTTLSREGASRPQVS